MLSLRAKQFQPAVLHTLLLIAIRLSIVLAPLQGEITTTAAQVPLSKSGRELEGRLTQTGPTAHIIPPEQQVIQGNKATFASKSSSSSAAPITRYQWTGPAGQKSTSRSFIIDTTRLSPGNYPVELRVTDRRERFDEATARLVVKPKARSDDVGVDTRAPVAQIDPTYAKVIHGERKRFTNQSYHPNPNGRIVRVNWRTEWGQPGSDNFLDVDTRSLSPRVYWIYLDISDHRGVRRTAKATLEISPPVLPIPKPPVARIFPRNRAVEQGVMVSFDGKRSSDPDGKIQSWSWKLDSQFLNNGPVTQIDTSKLTPHDYSVQLEVTDEQNLKATDSIILTVAPRKRPVDLAFTDLQVFPEKLAPRRAAEIKAVVTNHGDEAVENVTVRFQVGAALLPDQIISTLAPKQTRVIAVRWVADAPGEQTLVATIDPDNRVDDLNRANNRSTRALRVLAPLVVRIDPDSVEVNPGERARFASEITSDPAKTRAGGIRFLWRGPTEPTAQTDAVEFDTKDIPPGKYSVTLQVTDENNQTSLATATLVVKELPISLWLSADSEETYTGKTVTFNGGTKPATAGIEYKFIFGDRHETEWQANAAAQHSFENPGSYKIRLLGRRGANSLGNAVTVLRVSRLPISPWLWVSIGIGVAAAGAEYVRRRFKKPAPTLSIEPRINLDSVTSTVDDHLDSSNSIRIRSVRGESDAMVEPVQSLIGARES